MFGPRIPNVAKIKSEEPRIDVVRRTFDFVLPICKQDVKRTFFSRLEIFLWRSSLERKRRRKKYDEGERGKAEEQKRNECIFFFSSMHMDKMETKTSHKRGGA